MSGKTKFPHAVAMEVAREITTSLRAICEPDRFVFAGSLRRMKPMVGDIEIVYIPRIESQPDPKDLFGNPVPTNLVDKIIDGWLQRGSYTKRAKVNGTFTWGAENKLAVHTASGIGVDFFQADRSNFFSLLVCRTGPAEFNTRICMEAERRGLRWNPYRGFEDRTTKALIFVPRSEKALFDYFNWPYLEPKDRV